MKVRYDESFLFPSSQLDFRGGLGRVPDDQIKMVQTRFGLQSLYMTSDAVSDLKAQYPDLPIDANGDLLRSTFLRFYIAKQFPNPTTDYDKRARAEYEQIIADLTPYEVNFQAAKAASDAAAPLRDALAQVETYVRAVDGANGGDIRGLAIGLRQQGDSVGARTLETIGGNLVAQANQVLANAQAAAAAGNLSAVQQYAQVAAGLMNDIRHQVQVADNQVVATAAEVQRQQRIAADIAAADAAENARNRAAAEAAAAAAKKAADEAAAAEAARQDAILKATQKAEREAWEIAHADIVARMKADEEALAAAEAARNAATAAEAQRAADAAATQKVAVDPATGTVQHTDTASGTTSTVDVSTGKVTITTQTGQTVTGNGSVKAGGVTTVVDTNTGVVTTQNTNTGVATQTDATTGQTKTAVQITGTPDTGGTFMMPDGKTVTTTQPITSTGLNAGKLALVGLVGLLLLRGAIK